MHGKQLKSGHTAGFLMQTIVLLSLSLFLGACGKMNTAQVEQALTCDNSHAFNTNRIKTWDATVTAVTKLNGIKSLDKRSGIVSSKTGSVDGKELSIFDTVLLGQTYQYSYEIALSDVSSTQTRVMVDVNLLPNQLLNREQIIGSVESYLTKKLYISICENLSASGERTCVNSLPCRGKDSAPQPVYSSPPTVKDVQRALSNKGYKPGPVDGIMGRKTNAALKKFQRDNRLAITGNIDRATTDRLLSSRSNIVVPVSTHQVKSKSKPKPKEKAKSKPKPVSVPQAQLVTDSEPGLDPDSKPSPVTQSEKGRLYVVVEDMSLQGEMNPFSTIILELSRGSQVTLLTNHGEWSEVEIQGKTGYIYSDSIQETSANITPSPETKTIPQPVATLPKAKAPPVQKQEVKPEPEPVPPQIEQPQVKIGIVNEEASIMTKPSSFSAVVVDISPGDEIKVLGQERDFLEVQYKGEKGFVYEEFIEIIE